MSYQWWVLLHLVGVFGLLISHGVSIAVTFRLRDERDPSRINALLDISGRTVPAFYASLGILLVGGIVAAFVGDLWSFGWIWASIATLVVVSGAMFGMARPYYSRVRFITRALADGSKAVSEEQFTSVLRARRPITITWVGFAGLGFILYLMLFKPTLGLAPAAVSPPIISTGRVVEIASMNSKFSSSRLTAVGGMPFTIRFRNADSGLPHNVAIYSDSSASRALFVGARFPGPATRAYAVPSIPAGTYFFRCDVHATTMTGSLVLE